MLTAHTCTRAHTPWPPSPQGVAPDRTCPLSFPGPSPADPAVDDPSLTGGIPFPPSSRGGGVPEEGYLPSSPAGLACQPKLPSWWHSQQPREKQGRFQSSFLLVAPALGKASSPLQDPRGCLGRVSSARPPHRAEASLPPHFLGSSWVGKWEPAGWPSTAMTQRGTEGDKGGWGVSPPPRRQTHKCTFHSHPPVMGEAGPP